jgi:hypothetical protein
MNLPFGVSRSSVAVDVEGSKCMSEGSVLHGLLGMDGHTRTTHTLTHTRTHVCTHGLVRCGETWVAFTVVWQPCLAALFVASETPDGDSSSYPVLWCINLASQEPVWTATIGDDGDSISSASPLIAASFTGNPSVVMASEGNVRAASAELVDVAVVPVVTPPWCAHSFAGLAAHPRLLVSDDNLECAVLRKWRVRLQHGRVHVH